MQYPIFEVYERSDLKIEIFYDEYFENPRKINENLFEILIWYSNYTLGDKNDYESPLHFLVSLLAYYYDPYDQSTTLDSIDVIHLENKCKSRYIIFPLYLYIGNDEFQIHLDSDRDDRFNKKCGYAFVSKEKINDEFGNEFSKSEENLKDFFSKELEEYNAYLAGEVYGYTIKNERKLIASGYNFFNLEVVKEEIDHVIQSYKEEYLRFWLNIDVVLNGIKYEFMNYNSFLHKEFKEYCTEESYLIFVCGFLIGITSSRLISQESKINPVMKEFVNKHKEVELKEEI